MAIDNPQKLLEAVQDLQQKVDNSNKLLAKIIADCGSANIVPGPPVIPILQAIATTATNVSSSATAFANTGNPTGGPVP